MAQQHTDLHSRNLLWIFTFLFFYLASYLSEDIIFKLITLWCLTFVGIGLGFQNYAALLINQNHFEKSRTLVFGFVSCGASVGVFVFGFV